MATINTYSPFPVSSGRNTPQMPPQPSQPTLLYFCSRTNGLLVPLIPADELPFNVRLQGVPRVIQLDQAHGMKYVGTAPNTTGITFKQEDDTNTMQRSNQLPATSHIRGQSNTLVNPFKQYLAPNALARQALAQSANNQAAASSSSTISSRPVLAHEMASNWRSNNIPPSVPVSDPTFTSNPNPADKAQFLIDAIVGSTSGAAEAARIGYEPKSTAIPPSGSLPDQDKKEFCTYWIRTGECDYTQQGCLYKHEMPDRATLEKIGFRTMPRWWAEKQSVVKLGGGEKASVGPIVKSTEWLKNKSKKSDDSDGSDSESEAGSSAKSTTSSKSSASSKKTSAELKKSVGTVPRKAVEIKEQTAAKLVKPMPSARTSTAAPVNLRKASTTTDLIDFAMPLLSTPPYSTPSLTPASSVESIGQTGQSTPLAPPKSDFSKKVPSSQKPAPAPNSTTTRVFVPKGESQDHHIAEAKKRAARQHARRAAPISSVGPTQPLTRQIQELQKGKHAQGLMASIHAPKTRDSTAQAPKGSTKTSCRIRRPAQSPPTVPAPAQKASGPMTIMRRQAAANKQG